MSRAGPAAEIRVANLVPGDVVDHAGWRATFLFAATPHPRHQSLWLVAWGSFDSPRQVRVEALNPSSHVGRLVRAGEDLSPWLAPGTVWTVERPGAGNGPTPPARRQG